MGRFHLVYIIASYGGSQSLQSFEILHLSSSGNKLLPPWSGPSELGRRMKIKDVLSPQLYMGVKDSFRCVGKSAS